MSKSLPKSRLARSTKLLGAAGRYAWSELSKRYNSDKNNLLNDAVISQANRLIESLDQLKGFPLKFGQLLSLDTTGLLPEEVRVLFERLQNKATAIDHVEMKEVLKSELPSTYEQLEVDWNSIASASIGQVYLAKNSNDEEIVLKIQYPGIEHSLEGDVLLLKKMAPILSKLVGKKLKWDGIFEELSDMFKREIDYEREAQILLRFNDLVSNNDPYRVPKLYAQYSTGKIIAMEYLKGQSFSKWFESNPSYEERVEIADACIELFCRELFDWGLVQTDPNFANFLICEDGKLGLLDFGASLEYGVGFVTKYKSLLRALYKGNVSDVIRLSIEFDLLDERESEGVKRAYIDMVNVSVAPFVFGSEFDFRDANYIEKAKNTSLEFVKLAKYTPPPRHLIFLHRKLAGLYSLLHRLEVKLDLGPYWDNWLK